MSVESKAPYYNLIRDYANGKSDTDLITSNPFWILAVARLAAPLSFSRKDMKSRDSDSSAGAKIVGNLLIIASDCVSLSISSPKHSSVKGLSAKLKQGEINYLTEILPGDWIVAWITDESNALDLVKKIREGKSSNPCNRFDNEFNDGLKFVGRIKHVGKALSVNRTTGEKDVSYSIQASGFEELNTQIFYDFSLATAKDGTAGLPTWFAKWQLDIRQFFATNNNGQAIDNVHKLTAGLLDIFLGRGLGGENRTDSSIAPLAESRQLGAGSNQEAAFAYLVPSEIAALLGISQQDASKKSKLVSYADILNFVVGVQKYENENSTDSSVFTPFIQENNDITNGSRKYTGTPLLGAFLPIPVNLVNVPFWSVLQQFLNSHVNEMYTAFRVNDKGRVLPTLTIRQIPFTTDALNVKIIQGDRSNETEAGVYGVTRFYNLPRWKLSSKMAYGVQVSRSDATRFNFIHVFGTDSNVARPISISSQIAQNPPIRDDIDVQRSGLRAYMGTVACHNRELSGKVPRAWMELIADRVIGSQYTLNGTIQSIGIYSPICEGDNLEFDGVVYHIESVSHNCQIGAGGSKIFNTTLELTNGLSIWIPNEKIKEATPIYPGFRTTDNRFYDPGDTAEYMNGLEPGEVEEDRWEQEAVSESVRSSEINSGANSEVLENQRSEEDKNSG